MNKYEQIFLDIASGFLKWFWRWGQDIVFDILRFSVENLHFFIRKSSKTHSNIDFESLGVSKNEWAYHFASDTPYIHQIRPLGGLFGDVTWWWLAHDLVTSMYVVHVCYALMLCMYAMYACSRGSLELSLVGVISPTASTNLCHNCCTPFKQTNFASR